MGVKSYRVNGKTLWKIDTWLDQPDGTKKRWRPKKIPTKAQAQSLERKAKSSAFENKWFEREKESKLTVEQAWQNYKPVVMRKRSAKTARSIAKRIVRHLGKSRVMHLTAKDVEQYRKKRLAEKTTRGGPPKNSTLDVEVEQLKRILNYAVGCGEIANNPLAKVKLIKEPNVRRVWLDEDKFEKLLNAAHEKIQAILIVAFETGMRKSEILKLMWNQTDLKEGVIRLAPQDTKTGKARNVYLTKRALDAIKAQPRSLTGYVFVNHRTGKPMSSIEKRFIKAREDAGMPEVTFHDLRRSFITLARKKGIPESVVMRMSGHRTRAVFDRYNVINDDDVREAVKVLEKTGAGNA